MTKGEWANWAWNQTLDNLDVSAVDLLAEKCAKLEAIIHDMRQCLDNNQVDTFELCRSIDGDLDQLGLLES